MLINLDKGAKGHEELNQRIIKEEGGSETI